MSDKKLLHPRARFRIVENVEYILKDAQGNTKKIFQENRLARFLIGKMGWLSPLWINSIFAPFISPFLGAFSDRRVISNLVTNAGMAGIASRINGSGSEAAFTYIAVGTGTNAAAATDTTLQTEITDSGLARAGATASRVTVDVTNDGARLIYTFSVGGTKAITESGVLNDATTGVLLARQVFTAVNVTSGDSLQITWTFDVD
jgi:hypothetical protein